MIKSKLGTWDIKDFLKGLFVSVVSGVLGAGVTALQTGGHVDLKSTLTIAGVAGGGYLIKQLGTNSNGELLTKEPNTYQGN